MDVGVGSGFEDAGDAAERGQITDGASAGQGEVAGGDKLRGDRGVPQRQRLAGSRGGKETRKYGKTEDEAHEDSILLFGPGYSVSTAATS
jgi:hypothetical protein